MTLTLAPPTGHVRRTIVSDPEWDAVAGEGWADRIMSEVVTDRLHEKQGRSIARWTLTNEERTTVVYLKRHYVLPRRLGLLARLFPSRVWSPGLQEWHHLCNAREIGLPVPRPMAAGEILLPGGRLQSFLAVEELTGMSPLHLAVPMAYHALESERFHRWKKGLAAEMARLTVQLHGRSYFHKDLYFCHFYIPDELTTRVPEEWQGAVRMIDFHRLARHRVGSLWWRVKDLAQLLYSSEVEGVTDRDRLRFWTHLRGRQRKRIDSFLLSAVRMKWRRYRAHNRKGK